MLGKFQNKLRTNPFKLEVCRAGGRGVGRRGNVRARARAWLCCDQWWPGPSSNPQTPDSKPHTQNTQGHPAPLVYSNHSPAPLVLKTTDLRHLDKPELAHGAGRALAADDLGRHKRHDLVDHARADGRRRQRAAALPENLRGRGKAGRAGAAVSAGPAGRSLDMRPRPAARARAAGTCRRTRQRLLHGATPRPSCARHASALLGGRLSKGAGRGRTHAPLLGSRLRPHAHEHVHAHSVRQPAAAARTHALR